MDPLSITASVVAIVGLSLKILGFLNDMKDLSSDKAKLEIEIYNMQTLLARFKLRLNDDTTDECWYATV